MRKKSTTRTNAAKATAAKTTATIKEATTKATELAKETVEKAIDKAPEVIEEAKATAADIAKSPVIEEAKATVEEAKAAVKKTVKEVAQKIETTRIAETTIELPGCAVTMTAIEEAVKKDMEAKEISGKDINVYINIDQKAAYYTVDGEGADNYRIDLTCL